MPSQAVMQEAMLGTSLRCPNCGTANEPSAIFCENCGQILQDIVCPHCGSPVDPETDFCEHCQNYISNDRCSFCYAPMSESDTYCQQCGQPRTGIVCPTCHSVSHFSFCEHCGTPLTDRARIDLETAWDVPFAQEVRKLEAEVERLWRYRPINTQHQRSKMEQIQEIRNRVIALLREEDIKMYSDAPSTKEIPESHSQNELSSLLDQKCKMLQALLDKMEMPKMNNPALARNHAMATKPHISKLAWRCNYKNALHPSPLACACPQKGGKWVILNGKEENLITD